MQTAFSTSVQLHVTKHSSYCTVCLVSYHRLHSSTMTQSNPFYSLTWRWWPDSGQIPARASPPCAQLHSRPVPRAISRRLQGLRTSGARFQGSNLRPGCEGRIRSIHFKLPDSPNRPSQRNGARSKKLEPLKVFRLSSGFNGSGETMVPGRARQIKIFVWNIEVERTHPVYLNGNDSVFTLQHTDMLRDLGTVEILEIRIVDVHALTKTNQPARRIEPKGICVSENRSRRSAAHSR